MVTNSGTLMPSLPDILDELRELQQFYSVWRAFTSADNRLVFEPIMKRYPVFFDSIVRAHFSSLVVGLYRIYDKREGTLTLRELYSVASPLLEIDKRIGPKAAALHTKIDLSWKKICILRSIVFGHRSAKLHPQQAFQKAELTPDELGAMIRHAQRLFNWITRALAGESHAFNLSAKKDIMKFMKRASKHAL